MYDKPAQLGGKGITEGWIDKSGCLSKNDMPG